MIDQAPVTSMFDFENIEREYVAMKSKIKLLIIICLH